MKLKDRVMEAIRSGELDVRVIKRPRVNGKTVQGWYRDRRIRLSTKTDDPQVAILLHEAIHHVCPRATEKWVLNRTFVVYRQCTDKELQNLRAYIRRRM